MAAGRHFLAGERLDVGGLTADLAQSPPASVTRSAAAREYRRAVEAPPRYRRRMLVARAKWRRLELTRDNQRVGVLRQRWHGAIAELPTATLTFRNHSNIDIRAYPIPADTDPPAPPSAPATMTATTTRPVQYSWKIQAADRRYQMVQGKRDRYTVTEHGDPLGNGWFTATFIHRQWLSLPSAVPLDHQAFIIWLAYQTFLPRQADL